MRNAEGWRESKFVLESGVLRGSRNTKHLSVSSRLGADIVARLYHEALPKHAKGHLLDLGCGKAPLYAAYRPFVEHVTCVDWANSAHKNEFLDHEVDLTKPLPFADESFDTILLSDVLEHIPVPLDLCHEIARILRPGGTLIMNVPFFYRVHEAPHDYYRYTEFALRRFMDQAKLEVVQLDATGGVPEILAGVIAKNVMRLPVVGALTARAVQWTGAMASRTRGWRRPSRASSRSFPLGYFMVARK